MAIWKEIRQNNERHLTKNSYLIIYEKVKVHLNFSNYTHELTNLCKRHGVKRLELFGSASRLDFNAEKSDLDFLVEFVDTASPGAFDRYFDLKEDLEQLFQRSIDLVELKAITNPYFQQAIDRDKVLLYDA